MSGLFRKFYLGLRKLQSSYKCSPFERQQQQGCLFSILLFRRPLSFPGHFTFTNYHLPRLPLDSALAKAEKKNSRRKKQKQKNAKRKTL